MSDPAPKGRGRNDQRRGFISSSNQSCEIDDFTIPILHMRTQSHTEVNSSWKLSEDSNLGD